MATASAMPGQTDSTSPAPARDVLPDGSEDISTLDLSSLMKAPALIAFLHGPNHVYQFVNERYVQLLGDRGYIGRSVREAIPELAEQGILEILDRVYTTGEPFVATEMALRLDRGTTGTPEEGFYDFVYQPLRAGSGAVTGIMVHVIDVTDEVVIRRRNEQLAAERIATLSQMAEGAIIVDTGGSITFQNEAARALLGKDGVGLSLETWLDTFELLSLDGSPLPREDAWLVRTVQSGEPSLGVERRLRRPDGREIIVQGSSTPVVAKDGSRYGSVFTFRDVTEQRQMEEARSALAAIVESSSDAVISTNFDGIVTSWDRGAELLYGYQASEIIGRPEGLLASPGDADEIRDFLAQVRRGESVEHIETVRRHSDGHTIDVSVSVSPIKDASGAITGAISIAHDIGRRKGLERERARHQHELTTRVLQAQEDERKRIARDLHDETVQALTTLLINLDVAERRLSEGSTDASSVLTRVRSIARRTLAMTRALAHSLRPPILDDAGLAAALEALGEEHAQTYSVRVSVEADTGSDRVNYLAPYVETVVFRVAQEALTNACKHAGGSDVRIRFGVDQGIGRLTVEDTGRGFDLQQMASSGSHSGLGLDGMRERAALIGGELSIETAPGQGTRVILIVPVGEEQSGLPGRIRGSEPPLAELPSPMKVLLVDDHSMVREGLKLILETQPGIQVVGEAQEGRQALELVEELHPDVVLMDIAMPNLNGFDATRQIKRRFPGVRVLILTSHDNRQYVTQVVKTGADGCLLKSSAGTELVTALETVQAGSNYVSPSIAGTLLDDYRIRIDRGGEDLLTEREREVVQLVAEGHTNQGVARKLGISVKTVESHRAHIMEKLGVADRTDLVKYAIRNGMISPE